MNAKRRGGALGVCRSRVLCILEDNGGEDPAS
jgi:hypothetical protein